MLDIYSNLLEQNWAMTAIDEMDIFYYFDVLAYRNKNIDSTTWKRREDDVYIDQVSWL